MALRSQSIYIVTGLSLQRPEQTMHIQMIRLNYGGVNVILHIIHQSYYGGLGRIHIAVIAMRNCRMCLCP